MSTLTITASATRDYFAAEPHEVAGTEGVDIFSNRNNTPKNLLNTATFLLVMSITADSGMQDFYLDIIFFNRFRSSLGRGKSHCGCRIAVSRLSSQ